MRNTPRWRAARTPWFANYSLDDVETVGCLRRRFTSHVHCRENLNRPLTLWPEYWGHGSCTSTSTCATGQTCIQDICRGDYGVTCTQNGDCVSGDCSATAHRCQIAGANCGTSYDNHLLIKNLALPYGSPCPDDLVSTYSLPNYAGTCCGNWGPGSCNGSSTCPTGQSCVQDFCSAI
jgi:hypothetical protein